MGNPGNMKVSKGVGDTLKLREGRQTPPTPNSWGCSLPSPLTTPHLFPLCGGARPWPCRLAELRPPARQHWGGGAASCRPRADPYSPAAPCPAPCHTRQGSAMEEDRAPGLLGPAFSRALATQSTRVPGSGAASPAPHPPLLNFNGRYPAHLAPHSGANRRRRHSRGPIAAPSTSRGHTPPGHRLPVPASPAQGGRRVSHTSGLTVSFLTPPLL